MEQLVAGIALKIRSEDANTLVSALEEIVDLKDEGRNSAPARNKLCRLLQEILAYERGSLVRRLLELILDKVLLAKERNVETCRLRLFASTVLAELTESSAIARFCGQEVPKVRALAKALLDQHAYLVQKADVAQKDVTQRDTWQGCIDIALDVTRCFVNLSRSSKKFWLSLQELDDFFPTVLKLASAEIAKLMRSQDVKKLMKTLMLLINTISVLDDSKAWALDQSFISMAAALTNLSLSDSVCDLDQESKLRQARETQAAFAVIGKAFKGGVDPQVRCELQAFLMRRVREEIERRMSTGIEQQSAAENSSTETSSGQATEGATPSIPKALAAFATGQSDTPVVSSWELCKSGSQLEAGRRFSKCASCSLAFYCSKEHQKSHWRTLKRHCKKGLEAPISEESLRAVRGEAAVA